jgi:hypothetical protein
MDAEQLNIITRDLQADSKHMRLLQILGQQLELLINEGRLYLVSEEEDRDLRATFAMEAVSCLCAKKRSRTDSDISGTGGDATVLTEYRYRPVNRRKCSASTSSRTTIVLQWTAG